MDVVVTGGVDVGVGVGGDGDGSSYTDAAARQVEEAAKELPEVAKRDDG